MSGLITTTVFAVVLMTASPVAAGEDYVVEPGDTLSEIASQHGSSISAIVAANGIDDPDFVRVGSVLVIPGADGTSSVTHVVSAGDTLASIAVKYGTSIPGLVAANEIPNPDFISIGQTLRVTGVSSGGGGAPSVPGTGGAADPSLRYEVRAGDTLANIAHAFGVSSNNLLKANSLDNPNLIRVGQTLTIPAGGTGGDTGTVCVVEGGTYVDDFGYVKPTGSIHRGIDVFAPAGTPVRAPVSGTVDYVNGTIGGFQFWLYGVDGNRYIGTHMSGFATSASTVSAGDVLGWVGDTGNAIGGPPHLHYEVHVAGQVVNPYSLLNASC